MSCDEDILKADDLGKEDCILEPEVIVTVKEEGKTRVAGREVNQRGISMHNFLPCAKATSKDNFEFVLVKDEPQDVLSGGEEESLEDIEITESNAFGGIQSLQLHLRKEKSEVQPNSENIEKSCKAAVTSETSNSNESQNMSDAMAEPLAGPSTSGTEKTPVPKETDVRPAGIQKVNSMALHRTVGL